MQIRMLFATRKDDVTFEDGSPVPELLEAWDEYSIDENPQGAEEAFSKALDAIGNELDQFRFATLDLPTGEVTKLFEDSVIDYREGILGATK